MEDSATFANFHLIWHSFHLFAVLSLLKLVEKIRINQGSVWNTFALQMQFCFCFVVWNTEGVCTLCILCSRTQCNIQKWLASLFVGHELHKIKVCLYESVNGYSALMVEKFKKKICLELGLSIWLGRSRRMDGVATDSICKLETKRVNGVVCVPCL